MSNNGVPHAPIFVVGPPRSGTTLMGQILGRHPQVFSPGETHFFEDLWSRRGQLGPLTHETEIGAAVDCLLTLFGRFNFPNTQRLVEQVIEREALVAQVKSAGGGYAALYSAFMGQLARSQGKQLFVDDTPRHLYHLPAIWQLWPEARIIGCVRDPRDFLCSYKHYWRRSTESERIKALYHPIVTSLLWRSAAGLLLRYGGAIEPIAPWQAGRRLLLVHYEQLVSQPDMEIERVCRFLGLAFTPAMTAVESHNSSFASAATGIFTTSVGRWHGDLTLEEVWWLQKLARRPMVALGYTPDRVQIAPARLAAILAQLPWAFLRALWANRQKRGPFWSYLWRRLMALVGQSL
ncbi:MAG: sulfotransferase [Chloroflexota bacterium]